eukprot:gb/GEZN01009470.1/.p1 GENE.gb/GEZN01009470.1/~~gb/GEZN01009470.1/.p1  ORF type:complete len:373 (-),score=58.77 gb/GEZN01009470.1/:207-1286(-)
MKSAALATFLVYSAVGQDVADSTSHSDSSSSSSSWSYFECDSSTWSDDAVPCADDLHCTAYVVGAESHRSCNNYCAAQEHGLTCVAAYEEVDNTCTTEGEDLGCDFDFYASGTSDMICQCTSEIHEPDNCDTYKHGKPEWDWNGAKTSVRKYCGSCKVLTTAVTTYQTCDWFCAYQGGIGGLACVGAWSSAGDKEVNGTLEASCGVEMTRACSTNFNVLKEKEMVCECDVSRKARPSLLYDGQVAEEAPKKAKGGKKRGLLAIGILLMIVAVMISLAGAYLIWNQMKEEKQQKEQDDFTAPVSIHKQLREPLTPSKRSGGMIKKTPAGENSAMLYGEDDEAPPAPIDLDDDDAAPVHHN